MARFGVLFVLIALVAALLAGCGASSAAGEADAGGTTGQPAAQTPPPDLVDPAEQSPTSQAAGETPSILGSTPEAGPAGVWERHRFFDVWDVGYPDGWVVDRPGTGEVLLRGPYGEHEYQVELTRPTDVEGEDLAGWAQADLASIDQAGAPRQEVSPSSMPALKVTNLRLPDQGEDACPAVRVYARTDKIAGAENFLVLTITQAGDTACDPAAVERLADALVAEIRS